MDVEHFFHILIFFLLQYNVNIGYSGIKVYSKKIEIENIRDKRVRSGSCIRFLQAFR